MSVSVGRQPIGEAGANVDRQVTIARAVLCGVALAAILLYVAVSLQRIWFALPLNEVELAMVAHVRRLSRGLPTSRPAMVWGSSSLLQPIFFAWRRSPR